MNSIWQRLKSLYPTNERARSSPRMADVALEVLQNLGEEAKDVVYYEALHRVHHGENNDGQGEKEPNKWSTVRRRMATTMRTNSVFGINGRPQEQATNNTSYFFSGNSFIGNILTKITRLYSRLRGVIVDPESDLYYFWMGTVAFAVLYNFWVIILRLTFLEMRSQSAFIAWVFMFCDLTADMVYLLDIVVQFHTAYLEDGIIVRDQGKLWRNYKQKSYFVSDVISIFPLNFIFNFLQDPLLSQVLRIPRLFKWHTISDMFEMSDSRTSKPYGVRALKLTIYLAIIIHWFACFYFMICEYEGLGSTGWTYPELKGNDDRFIRKYIKSLFWAALTLTTIGENESPETTLEYVFTGCTFLIGVLLFATIVGNMGDVVSSMNAARAEFQERMDGIKRYMEHHEIPEQLQDRVKRWLQYSWSRTKALEEQTTLGFLPHRLRTEIAINVHLETLKKVKIFKDCEQGFLCELVLKLRSQIFSPEDYICRIGEIGREMYIINHGKVEVVVRDSSSGDPIVVASLSDGNYFGEISLLRLDGGTNRRTADVRSVGYSELLCLSKKDLMEALKEYPEAHEILEAQGRDRLQRTKTEKNAMRLRTKNKDTAEEDSNSIEDGVKELKSLVEQLKCFDKLEEKLQATQLQNQCNALRLQVEEMEIELKKSRKRSYALERMLLSRSNGFYDATKEFEELSMDNGVNNDNLRDLAITNHMRKHLSPDHTETNHMRDDSYDSTKRSDESCDQGTANHITDESSHDHEGTTSHMTDDNSRSIITIDTMDESAHGYTARTNHTTENYQDKITRTNHIRDTDPRDPTKATNLMLDNSREAIERTNEATSRTRDQGIIPDENDVKNSLDPKSFTLILDRNNNSATQVVESYENTSRCLREYQTDLPREHFIKEAPSFAKSPHRRSYPQKDTRYISVYQMNLSHRRSSV